MMRGRARCMKAAMVVVTLILLCLVNGVESARLMSVAMEQRGVSESTTVSSEVADDGRRTPTATAPALNAYGVDEFSGGGGDGGGVDPVWDAEAESPPAQRQRDRSLWGMSKRLVPTGPNPLHN